MPRVPAISALIPTRGRVEALRRCLLGLAAEVANGIDAEVVVGLDGADAGDPDAIRAAWAAGGAPPSSLRIETLPRAGYIPVRSRLLPTLRGDVYLSMNDDVEPAPGFLRAHLDAHAGADRPTIFVGDSTFAPVAGATLVDALVADHDLVFFWRDVHRAAAGRHALGWRHAFGLNCSMPRAAALAAGGYPDLPGIYGYDDVALAWRLRLPVLPCPAARAPHHHRYALRDLLEREVALGRAAVAWAQIAPEFMRELTGIDLREPSVREELARSGARLRADAELAEAALEPVAARPAGAVPDETRELALAAFRLVKRVRWLQGASE